MCWEPQIGARIVDVGWVVAVNVNPGLINHGLLIRVLLQVYKFFYDIAEKI